MPNESRSLQAACTRHTRVNHSQIIILNMTFLNRTLQPPDDEPRSESEQAFFLPERSMVAVMVKSTTVGLVNDFKRYNVCTADSVSFCHMTDH